MRRPNRPARSGAPGPFDARAFWEAHDRALVQPTLPENLTLTHDLYRGMPAWFNAYYAFFQRRAWLHLLRRVDVAPGLRALDVGCGTGRWTALLLERGLEVWGVDVGRQVLHLAAGRYPQASFVVNQLPDLSFPPGYFDLAVSVTVLQHVPYAQQAAALQALARVLRPGGSLLLCESIHVADPSRHVFANCADRWLDLFSEAGLAVNAYRGCEYLPHVTVFQRGRALWQKLARSARPSGDVSSVARLLERQPLLAVGVHLGIWASYPVEYVAAAVLPWRWARLGCFLLTKP